MKISLRLALALALLTSCLPSLWAQRLPGKVIPEHYQLTFSPDLNTAKFTGVEAINVKVLQPTNTIVLNSAEIEITHAMLHVGDAVQEAKVSYEPEKEEVMLTVPNAIPAGRALIHLTYNGILNDKLHGFYLSKTERRNYAVTQFESTDARRAFPSFDEPAMKATFDISLVIDKSDTAISNGSIVSDTPGPGEGKHTLKFSTTPKLSSYLIAMLVGDFQCLSGSSDGIPVRVCAVPEKKQLGSYALTSAEQILHFYDHYFSIKYPFKKLDIIALPDFAAGAMENAGAITYRETFLLIDDKNASVDAHQQVVGVLAHEMAHQWFGDLVTMQWWDNIWLNEGFATWMANKPTEALHPGWKVNLDEVGETNGALNVDSIASIRPIRQKAETPAEIEQLFDGIAYGKAASVLRMLESYVKPEVFRMGVNNYLQAHAYANATAENFWSAIAAASKKPIDKIMPTFVDQPGAPMVNVHASCKASKTEVRLEQQRFLYDREKSTTGADELWQIPVCMKAPGTNSDSCQLLTQKRQTFTVNSCAPWVFSNANGYGYYRSNYTPETVHAIASQAENALNPQEQISFLDDLWATVRAGEQPIGSYLTAVEGLKNERTFAVVNAMVRPFDSIHDQLVSVADRPAFEAWVRRLLHPMMQQLGYQQAAGESDDRKLLRARVFEVLGEAGKDPEVIEHARSITADYMNNPASEDASVAGNALAIAGENGDASLYNKYLEHITTAKSPEEHYNYYFALANFQQPELIQRTLEYVLSPAVRNQDLFIFRALMDNPAAQLQSWEFIKSHWKQIREKAGAQLGGGFAQLSGAFCDARLRDDSQQFFAEANLPGSQRTLRNARERVNACIRLRDLQQPKLTDFLKQQPSLASR